MDMHNLKKKFAIAAALLAPLLVTWFILAQPVPGTAVNGPIVPFDARDTYSTLDPWWAAGVFRDATNFTALNSIPPARRVRGMRAYTSSDHKYWVLQDDLVTWIDETQTTLGGTNNLYNRDGTLTGLRQLTLGGNQLQILGNGLNGAVFDPTLIGIKSDSVTLDGRLLSIIGSEELTFVTHSMISGTPSPAPGWVLTLDDADGKANFRPLPTSTATNNVYNQDGRLTGTRQMLLDGHQFQIKGNGIQGVTFDPDLYGAQFSSVSINGTGNLTILANNELTFITPSMLSGTPSPAAGWVLTLDDAGGTANFRPPASSGSGLNAGTATLAGGIYTVATPNPPHTSTAAYSDFFTVNFRPNLINAGNESLKWGSGPVKPLKTSYNTPIPSGELAANVNYVASFDTTLDAWVVKNSASTLAFNSSFTTSTAGSVTTVGLSAGAAGPTIYTGDGTLTGNRIVNINMSSLAFNGSGAGATFSVNTPASVNIVGGTDLTLNSPTTASLSAPSVEVEGSTSAQLQATAGQASVVASTVATLDGGTQADIHAPIVKVRPSGLGTATVGQALRLVNTSGQVDYSPDPAATIGNNTVTAAKLSFVGTNSFFASTTATGAGTEIKLDPTFIIKRGVLMKNWANIMFEINSFMTTSSGADGIGWGLNGGTFAGLDGVNGHAGITTMNTTAAAAPQINTMSFRAKLVEFVTGNKMIAYGKFRIPTLSTGGESFRYTAGFGNKTTAVAYDTDCVTICYSDLATDNSGVLSLDVAINTAGGASATGHLIQTSGLGAYVANTWIEWEIEMVYNQIRWWINGVEMTPVTTNIPANNSSSKLGPEMALVSLSGSTAKTIHLDQYNAIGFYSY